MHDRALRLAFLADPRSVHTRRWLGFFASRGHSVTLLVGGDEEINPELDPGIEIRRYRQFGRRRIPFFSSLQGAGALRRLVREIRPEILHAHYLTRFGWQAVRSGFHPYVVTGWGSDLLLDPHRSLRARLWARVALRGATLVTTPSNQLAEVAVTLGASRARVHRIPFGVDTREFIPSASRDEIGELGLADRRILFSPRAVRPLYRQEVVVAALAELPEDVVLVMSGRNADAAYLAGLRRQAIDLGVTDRVRVIDEISRPLMTNLFQAAEAIVSVPSSDGMPASILEAMACATPVIATDLAGPREALGPLADGLLIPAESASATLVAALTRLLEMPDGERRALREALRRRAEEEFDYVEAMSAMEELYRQVRTAA
jgi:glycosyltransferase involved in cell wall biosynthesis